MSAEPAPRRLSARNLLLWGFALVGLLGILAFIAIAVLVFRPLRTDPPAEVAATGNGEAFTVGEARHLRGTGLLQMNVSRSGGRGGSGSLTYSSGDIRNILIVDKATGASRRLLPDNSRRIEQARWFSAAPGSGEDGRDPAASEEAEEAPLAYYLVTVSRPGEDGRSDVLIGRLSDFRQDMVLRGVDGIDEAWMESPTRMGMMLRENRRLVHRIVDIPSLSVVSSTPVAID